MFREIDNEIYAHLPIWDKAVMLIGNIGYNIFSFDNFLQIIFCDSAIQKYCKEEIINFEDIIEMLFNFGVLGTIERQSGKRWIFKYKDHDLQFNKKANLILHVGLKTKVRLKFGNALRV